MVKLSKTRLVDALSTVAYFFIFLGALLALVVVASLLKALPQLLGLG